MADRREIWAWKCQGAFWLLVASLLALVINVPLAVGDVLPSARTGCLLLALPTVMLYGVAWPLLMSLTSRRATPSLFFPLLWFILLLWGVWRVLDGLGSGMPEFAFDQLVGWPLILVAGACVVNLRPGRQWPFVCLLLAIVASSWTTWCGDDVALQMGCRELLATIWALTLLTVSTQSYLALGEGRWKKCFWPLVWLVLILLTSPVRALQVSSDFRELVVSVLFLCILISAFKTQAAVAPFFTIGTLLGGLCWVAYSSLQVGLDGLAPMSHLYRTCVFVLLLLVVGAGRAESSTHRRAQTVILVGSIIMLLSMIMERVLFASVDVSWQMMPLPLSVAWGCIALGSLIFFWQLRTTTEVNSLSDANQSEHHRGYLIVLLVVVASALRLIGVSAMEQGVVKRPISDPMGAQVYAAQGCAMCHTQLIRRDPQGTDLQRELDAGIEQVRASEIEDWSASMGESSVHMGEVSIGPDLFNLVEKLETRPDVQTGGVSDWLYLHLYNPRDARLRHPYSVCPSLADDFILQPMRKNQKSEDALAVQAPSGMEVIPSEKIKHLVTYLLSLKRGAVCATQTNAGREVLIPQEQLNQRYYVDSNYAQNPPQLKKPSRGLSERTLARGRALYLSKCSQCHGEEGQGKENLYPPLKGSEWVDKDSKTLTQIIRTGLTGPITVKGQSWNSTMLPPGVTNQTDIDAIIGYLRTHFGATHGGVAPTETNFPQK